MATSHITVRLRHRGLLPHQAAFVETVLGRSVKRVVLSSGPGLGKGMAAAALVAELFEAEPLARCLILCPATLGMYWQDLLSHRWNLAACLMNAPLYRRLQADTAGESNPWREYSLVVSSYDFAKPDNRLQDLVSATWTLVICDELHICKGLRGNLVGRLWSDAHVSRCVGLTIAPQEVEWLLGPRDVHITWLARDLQDWAGKPLLRPRTTVSASFSRTPEERQLRRTVMDGLQTTTGAEGSLVRQAIVSRMDSSLYALEQTLRRLQSRSQDVSAGEQEDGDESLELATQGGDKVLADDVVTECLSMLESVSTDSKLVAATSKIAAMLCADDGGVIVFTQFRDTAYYVASALVAEGLAAEHLSGADSLAEREMKIAHGRREPCALVCEDAAVDGVDLSFAHRILHYDLPADPMMIERRLGRVMRLAQTEDVETTVLVCEDPDDAEGNIGRLLSQRLEAFGRAFGGGI